MAKKVYMMKGLPGSGKSTLAREMMSKDLTAYKRINKDELRLMLDNGKYTKTNEKFIVNLRNHLIKEALLNGFHVIVDDTNLSPKHEITIREIVRKHNVDNQDHVEFKVIDLTDVPVRTCIERDLKRLHSVGKDVILRMFNQFIKPELEKLDEKYRDK